jgi:UDP-N-acetylmuramoyl-tripeptide--D-alanyl-D-alanine ligase
MEITELYSIFDEYPAVSTDSRNIIPDSLFFALRGDRFDGNRYVAQALAAGCAFAVTDDAANTGIPGCIVVDDVLTTLQQLAAYHRRQFAIPVLAITGTNGKTTTKELCSAVLSKKFRTVSTRGNLNNHIGAPLTLLRLDRRSEFAIVEMGASHRGEIAALCDIVRPDVGIVTNIGRAHLEGFGSEDGIRRAKGELYDWLASAQGTIFYNADDPVLCEMARRTPQAYAVPYGATVQGATTGDGLLLNFSTRQPALQITTGMAGNYNLNNALAAIAVGVHFGVPETAIVEALEQYRPDNNRSQVVKTERNTVIMDAYNANPSSMEAAVRNFAALAAPNKFLILGDMRELGGDAPAEHRRLVDLTRQLGFKNVILTGETFCKINTGDGFALYFPDCNSAGEYLQKAKLQACTVLLKASRKTGLETLLKYL